REKNKCKKIKIKHSKDINGRNDDSKTMLLLNSTNSTKNCKSIEDPTPKLNRAKNVTSKSKKPYRNLTKNTKPLIVDVDENSSDSVLFVQSDSEVSVRRQLQRSTRCKNNSILTYIVGSDLEDYNDEARKQFLLSGIPEALKKNIQKQQSFENIEPNYFPKVSHIQQKHIIENGIDYWNLPIVKLNTVDLAISLPKIETLKKGALNNVDDGTNNQHPVYTVDKPQNLKPILLEIKKNNPGYPVFKSFRLLMRKAGKLQTPVAELQKMQTKNLRGRKSKKQKTEKILDHQIADNNPITTMMWSEKYKANTSDDLIGNHASTLELRKWLQSWATISESGSTNLKYRDSSSPEFDCDSQSRDSTMYPSNAVIVHGPHGTGKTMTIYALCNDLGINVLELNASSKRTGKRLMQELQEATQSHQVRKNENLDLNDLFKRASNKKHVNTRQSKDRSIKNPKMCLLLVEDIDIVFEQDDGFLNGLIQLLLTSKRPIILVANDISSPNLQKIISQYSIIEFLSLTPKVMTVWLQILCLIEGCFINKESLSELLDWNKGDVRKTLLQLQFWVETGGGSFVTIPLNESEECKVNFEDEFPNDDSHLFILDETCDDDTGAFATHSNCISTFIDHSQVSLDKIWRNLYKQSRLKGNAPAFPSTVPILEHDATVKTIELEQFHEHFDTLSLIDKSHVSCGKVENSLSVKNSLLEVKDSIELSEVYVGCNYRKDFIEEWSQTLLSHCTNLYSNQSILDMGLPSAEDKRWEKKQRTCKSKFVEAAPLSCFVDKRLFALDYYPTLRTISRSEKGRFANTHKRKNRFFNYLRVLGLHVNDSVVNTA
ncbi:AAA protein, partial [Oryctes borbonicus]